MLRRPGGAWRWCHGWVRVAEISETASMLHRKATTEPVKITHAVSRSLRPIRDSGQLRPRPRMDVPGGTYIALTSP
jgi:hypothetical protein